MTRSPPTAALATALALLLLACGGAERERSAGGEPDALEVLPAAADLGPFQTVTFAATAAGSAIAAVAWDVLEQGGGLVTSTGLYTAPAGEGTFRVRATSVLDASKSAVATVTVRPAAATCSYTYSAWSACSAGGTQTRAVVSSTPAGCAGTPVLTQPCTPATTEVLAFPGAEGFGARATGGRGGRVVKVTNLNASGPGSLQAALDVNAPRIVVFAVSGVITGNVNVTYGNVTIAGQTAPGAGITIAGRLIGEYDAGVQNIVVRHVRVRAPACTTANGCDGAQHDAIQFSRNARLILDHVSAAYGADETIDLYEADDVTVQWSTIEPSQRTTAHPDGNTHNYGMIQGPDGHRITLHHNLCAHHSRRCPAIANGPADVRNNVAYNVRHAFLHSNPGQGNFNFVGNYFKQGPNDSLMPYFFDDEDPGTRPSYYLRDSYVDDPGQLVGSVDDPWSNPGYFTSLGLDASYRAAAEFDFRQVVASYVPVTTQAATAAYELVLAQAGAFPRDAFTIQTVNETRSRTGAWSPPLPSNLMSGLTPGTAPADADGDGMADAWEVSHGLDPANGADHATVMPSGYTAIEEYVNELASTVVR